MALVAMLVSAPALAISDISISADTIRGEGFTLKNSSLHIKQPLNGEIQLRIGEADFASRKIKSLGFDCTQLQVSNGVFDCAAGKIAFASETSPIALRIDSQNKKIDFKLQPNAEESASGTADFAANDWSVRLNIVNAEVARIADLLPAAAPRPTKGVLSGTLNIIGNATGMCVEPDVVISNLYFSDKEGLRAGEKLVAALKGSASKQGDAWRFQGELDYRSGEALWTPLYFEKGGHTLKVAGSADDKMFRIETSTLRLADVGSADIGLNWDAAADKLTEMRLRGKDLDLEYLYKIILKPYLAKTAFDAINAKGRGDIEWHFAGGETKVFDLALHQADIEDVNNRFSLSGLNLNIPWALTEKREARIQFSGAKLLNIPLGKVDTPVAMNGYDFSMPRLILPIFDGKLEIKNFVASEKNGDWSWKFSGALSPLSMTNLTKTLKLPQFSGNLSGEIPEVEYANHDVKMSGALVMQLFDGFAVIKDVALYQPLGNAPRMTADVDAHNLDLSLMTTAFSFGKMQGLVDVRVADMELVKWKPVKMEASVMSSPGDYPKKISQQAVQNISALGGAGAAAAIQRSFLGFFEQFGYNKIGLTCKLRNNICEMNGVESTPQGYVIVKGGGIPAITVMGYNRTVGWQELLDRVSRITQENAKPIVQ